MTPRSKVQEHSPKIDIRLLIRIFFFVILIVNHANAQSTTQVAPIGSELGFRMGALPALSYRFVPTESQMIELLFANTHPSLLFTALYQKQLPIGPPGFYYRYGGGFSVGGWNQRLVSGVDLQVGADYYLPILPVVISLDVRPWVRLTGLLEASGELAATVRYVF